jgi:hypothetical protein
MQSFEELADFILKNSKHNTQKETKRVHIILDYPKLTWGDYYQYLMTLTWITGIEWSKGGSKSCNLIFAKTLDEAVKQADEYDYAIVSYVGTFYKSYEKDAPETIHYFFDKFCKSQQPCKGHILWHPDNQYGRLHLQSMFLNLSHWRKIGKPSFGNYSGKVMLPEKSKSNVHDDYTPHWIKPSNEYTNVTNAEMAEYISKVLEDGQTILNYDTMERNSKFFTYPERKIVSEQLKTEQSRSSNIIYTENNDGIFKIHNVKNIYKEKFDVIYAPAAGYIAEFLYKNVGHKDTKLIIYDNHIHSLSWKKMIYQLANDVNDIERINKYFAKQYNCIIDTGSYKKNAVTENHKIFSKQDWLDTIKTIKNYDIIEFDLIKDKPFNIDKTKKNLIYMSNIFSYMFLYHKEKIENVHAKYLEYTLLPNTVIYGTNVFKDQFSYKNNINESEKYI